MNEKSQITNRIKKEIRHSWIDPPEFGKSKYKNASKNQNDEQNNLKTKPSILRTYEIL